MADHRELIISYMEDFGCLLFQGPCFVQHAHWHMFFCLGLAASTRASLQTRQEHFGGTTHQFLIALVFWSLWLSTMLLVCFLLFWFATCASWLLRCASEHTFT